MFIVLTIFVVISIGLLYYTLKNFKRNKFISAIPGKNGWPFLGNSLDFLGPRDEMIQRFQNYIKYGEEGIVKAWFGPNPVVILSKAKTIEPIVTSSVNISKSVFYKFLSPWLGTGLLTSTGKKWQHRRRLLTPAFHFRILDDFAPMINEQSEILVRNLEPFAGKKDCDIFKFITLCSLDIICATAMGKNLNAQSFSNSDYVTAIDIVSELVTTRAFVPWYLYDWLYYLLPDGKKFNTQLQILHKFTKTVIEDKKKELISRKQKGNEETETKESVYGQKRRVAFLDLLLEMSEDGKVLSDEDIQEEVDTFMFEGHDTTSSGIFWSLYHLGLNHDVQSKLHEELDYIFGDDPDSLVTSDHLPQLKYLECVIKEAMRICPPVPFFGRDITEDLKIGNYTIPAGADCTVFTYALHRDEEYFPDPEKFDPDRFLPENSKGRHPYAYIPFSAGPRNCIGQKFAMMEEKIMLVHVLRKFKVNTLYRKGDIRGPGELILRPSAEIKMQIIPKSQLDFQ